MSYNGHEPYYLRSTNVSNPSIIVDGRGSRQSLTASEDYYSLSSASSTRTEIAPPQPLNIIHRYETPPERYRTPLQSRDNLALQQQDLQRRSSIEELRHSPIHGQGKRRSSQETPGSSILKVPRQSQGGRPAPRSSVVPVAESGLPPMVAAGAASRDGTIRRKPISTAAVMETPGRSWLNEDDVISPHNARSSMAQELDREPSPPTPGMDDSPYLHFALDQLTRDEEVRGSRTYGRFEEGPATAERQTIIKPTSMPMEVPIPPSRKGSDQSESQSYQAYRPPSSAPPLPAGQYQSKPQPRDDYQKTGLQWPRQEARQDQFEFFPTGSNRSSPTRGFREDRATVMAQPLGPPQERQPDVFLPVDPSDTPYHQLNALPKTLSVPGLGLFTILLILYLVCLLFCAIWSMTHTGLWRYQAFGDARYFVFQYLPTILGIILFIWLVHIIQAVYRIAPFIALASHSSDRRGRGTRLPLYPRGFVLPYFGHFTARQPIIGVWLFIAWLQIFSVPLLACCFNAYFYGSGSSGQWRWIAVAAAIWPVIGLYVLLLLASLLLLLWLKRSTTGLKWDPRSLADIIVLLGRSNALDSTSIDNTGALLGYWRSSLRTNEVFHTYGIAERPGRQYRLSDGRLVEKSPRTSATIPQTATRESCRGEQRNSREKMLPRPASTSTLDSENLPGSSLPWFLRPAVALLWTVTAIVLLAAFLVVSYIPATRIFGTFNPMVPAFVSTLGFSGTNYLYSIVPAALAMLCLLFWLDIDYTHRRLVPFTELARDNGSPAERSLLLSYPADLPLQVTLAALINKHFQIALLSFTTLIAASLPILAGGVFWSQFDIPTQRIRIYAHQPAYYALTALVSVYAIAYLFIFPSRLLRKACKHLPSKALSFQDHVDLVHQSRMLDDVTFYSPASKTILVTRLLSAAPGARLTPPPTHVFEHNAAMSSNASLLADSLRGFGRARQHALGGSLAAYGTPKYSLSLYWGRDGREYYGIDRFRE